MVQGSADQGPASDGAGLRGLVSQAFYRERLDIESLGYSSLEDFLVGFWEGFFLQKDANNLLAMLWNWQNGDISDNEL